MCPHILSIITAAGTVGVPQSAAYASCRYRPAIIGAYLRYGERFTNKFRGEYAIVLYDFKKQFMPGPCL